MTYLLKFLIQNYQYGMTITDERVKGWPLMDSEWPIYIIEATYLYFVKVLGPKLMEHRKPFAIKKLIMVYNIFQILMNGYICIKVANVIFREFNIYCNPIDYSTSPSALSLLNCAYIYFLNKMLDLLDTVFFVLTKKSENLSFLHVYHHWGMSFYAWFFVRYFGGGQSFCMVFLNTLVHMCMYTYYLLSQFEGNKKYLEQWKRRMTEMQLVQFVLGIYFASMPLYFDCKIPLVIILTALPEMFMMLALFSDFYIRKYIRQ